MELLVTMIATGLGVGLVLLLWCMIIHVVLSSFCNKDADD